MFAENTTIALNQKYMPKGVKGCEWLKKVKLKWIIYGDP